MAANHASNSPNSPLRCRSAVHPSSSYDASQNDRTLPTVRVANVRPRNRAAAATATKAAAAAAAVRKPFLPKKPVSSGLLPTLLQPTTANSGAAFKKKIRAHRMNQRSVQQRPWTDNGSPKSKIRFPVGSNSERSRLSTRARFLVKVPHKTPIHPLLM